MRFRNRTEAGKELAHALAAYKDTDAVVYALPRGGVIFGYEIARVLGIPLDLVITRKIGHPMNPEYAVCAITETGTLICNEFEKKSLDTTWFHRAEEEEVKEAKRRRSTYLKNTKHISAQGKIAIIVDDGIATGLTIRAAAASLHNEHPRKLIIAVPVAPHDVVLQLKKEVDDVVLLEDAHDYLGSVGAYYDEFPQMSDEEVITLLKKNYEIKNGRPRVSGHATDS